MAFKVKISVLVILILINQIQSKSISNDYTLNLCQHSNDVNYENYTDPVTQNCGCEKLDTCIRKCCQNGFFYNHDEDANDVTYTSMCSKQKSYQMYPFSVPIYDSWEIINYYVIENFLVGMLNCKNTNMFYIKMNGSDPYNFFYLERNGSLYYPHHNLILSNERYCVDEGNGLSAYFCFQPEAAGQHTNMETIIHVTAKLISIPFLMATGLVYALLPERNLHRSALMFHVFCLLLGNALLACGQYTVIEDDGLCFSLGYSILLFMVASFFWMNVICIDIFLVFRSITSTNMKKKFLNSVGNIFSCILSSFRAAYVQEKIKRIVFKIASLYAWGLPISNVLIVFVLNNYGDEEAEYHPGIGVESCFLKNGLPTLIFYFGPILVIIIINIVLFILTAVNLRKIKTVENSQNKKRPHKLNDKFILYWKLLFVMGLNPVVNTHVIQLISWTVGRKWSRDVAVHVWYFKDFAHASYGILIFLIFVCQKKIWLSLKERICCTSKKNNVKASEADSSVTSNSENDPPGIHLRGIQNTAG